MVVSRNGACRYEGVTTDILGQTSPLLTSEGTVQDMKERDGMGLEGETVKNGNR